MSWLVVAAAVWSHPPEPLDLRRVLTTRDLHVGVAAHVLVSPGEVGVAGTVQVTVRVPW